MPKTRFSKQEAEHLRLRRSQGATYQEISREMGRNVSCLKFNVNKWHHGSRWRRSWSDEEIAIIIDGRVSGKSVREIADSLPQKTFHAVGSMISSLIVRGWIKSNVGWRNSWSDAEISTVVVARDEGRSLDEIAELLPHKKPANIQSLIFRLIKRGLVKNNYRRVINIVPDEFRDDYKVLMRNGYRAAEAYKAVTGHAL